MSTIAASQYGNATRPGTDMCTLCGQAITGATHRVSGAIACGTCAESARRMPAQLPAPASAPSTDRPFLPVLLVGMIGAAVGMALYSGFMVVTHLRIGYISLVVGIIVAKAVLIGSKGIGGRQYQITAAALTYAAVSLSIIPLIFIGRQVTLSDLGLAQVVAAGLISPFLELNADLARGMIGLVILFVGMRIAWKLTAAET